MVAKQFLEISICKPHETHIIHALQSIPFSSVSWVAQQRLEVLLNKDEAGRRREKVTEFQLATTAERQ